MDGMDGIFNPIFIYSCCWVGTFLVCRVLVRVGGNGGNVVQDGIQLNARYGK